MSHVVCTTTNFDVHFYISPHVIHACIVMYSTLSVTILPVQLTYPKLKFANVACSYG